jgi:hypothetical protein
MPQQRLISWHASAVTFGLLAMLLVCALLTWPERTTAAAPAVDRATVELGGRYTDHVDVPCIDLNGVDSQRQPTDQLDFDEQGIGTAFPPSLPQPVAVQVVDRLMLIRTLPLQDQSGRTCHDSDPDIPALSRFQKSTVVLLI